MDGGADLIAIMSSIYAAATAAVSRSVLLFETASAVPEIFWTSSAVCRKVKIFPLLCKSVCYVSKFKLPMSAEMFKLLHGLLLSPKISLGVMFAHLSTYHTVRRRQYCVVDCQKDAAQQERPAVSQRRCQDRSSRSTVRQSARLTQGSGINWCLTKTAEKTKKKLRQRCPTFIVWRERSMSEP